MNMVRSINSDAANSGTLKNLSEIGITIGDDLTLKISDSSKLTNALVKDKDNVTALLDTVMGKSILRSASSLAHPAI